MPADVTPRGCGGHRKPGGLYLEVAHHPHGKPFETFLADPVQPLDREQANAIPRVGVQLVTKDGGGAHVIDWVGAEHYQFAPDFLEEGRRHGFSRRLNRTIDLSSLRVDSYVFFVHSRGYLDNWHAWALQEEHEGRRNPMCARGDPQHYAPTYGEHCIRHLWAAAPRTSESRDTPDGPALQHWRSAGPITYQVYPPREFVHAAWVPAIVAAFPITNLTVIATNDGSHEKLLKKARNDTRLPVYEAVA